MLDIEEQLQYNLLLKLYDVAKEQALIREELAIHENDMVLTDKGEHGTVIKKYVDDQNSYDWWIEIKFYCKSKQKEFTCREPYKNSELKKLTKAETGV